MFFLRSAIAALATALIVSASLLAPVSHVKGQLSAMGVGGGFGPASGAGATCAAIPLSGCVGFWRADTGVTQSGGAVSAWADQSATACNLGQSNGANKPTYSASGFNTSYPGITVVQSDPQFVSASCPLINSTTMSVFMLFSMTNNSQSNSGVISYQAAGQSDDFNSPSFVVSTAVGADYFLFSSGKQGNGSNNVGLAPATPALVSWVFSGIVGNVYLNCVVQGASTVNTSTFGAAGNGTFALGTRPWNGNTPSFDGTYAFAIVTNTAASGTDCTNVKSLANTTWGTSL